MWITISYVVSYHILVYCKTLIVYWAGTRLTPSYFLYGAIVAAIHIILSDRVREQRCRLGI